MTRQAFVPKQYISEDKLKNFEQNADIHITQCRIEEDNSDRGNENMLYNDKKIYNMTVQKPFENYII